MAASAPSLAFVFDLDGVVVDSNDRHVASWQEVARRHGFACSAPGYIGKCGLRTTAVIRDLLHWPVDERTAERLGFEKEEIYRAGIRRDGIAPVPGVLSFLARARRLGIRCAIGSSAPRENVDLCLQSLGLTGLFGAVVSGADVARGKPAPDIFLKAAADLGAVAPECLVFEDAPAGIVAAHAAGMRVVALETSHTRAELADADDLARDFTGLDPARLLGAGCGGASGSAAPSGAV